MDNQYISTSHRKYLPHNVNCKLLIFLYDNLLIEDIIEDIVDTYDYCKTEFDNLFCNNPNYAYDYYEARKNEFIQNNSMITSKHKNELCEIIIDTDKEIPITKYHKYESPKNNYNEKTVNIEDMIEISLDNETMNKLNIKIINDIEELDKINNIIQEIKINTETCESQDNNSQINNESIDLEVSKNECSEPIKILIPNIKYDYFDNNESIE
jgi:hypothetical protein